MPCGYNVQGRLCIDCMLVWHTVTMLVVACIWLGVNCVCVNIEQTINKHLHTETIRNR